jgi:hypothetical protein
MVRDLKWGENRKFVYAELMLGSERWWDVFVGWPIDTTCPQGRPSDILSAEGFTAQCKSALGEIRTVQRKAQLVLGFRIEIGFNNAP